MGYGLYVKLDRPIPEVEGWDVCGKVLAQHLDLLDAWATARNLKTFSELTSISKDDLDNLLGEDLDDDLDNLDSLDSDLNNLIEEHWFTPTDGLETVDVMIQLVQENSDQLEEAPELLADLTAVNYYLGLAEPHKARFHFAIDI